MSISPAEDSLRAMVEASADYILMLDEELRVRLINRTAAGLSREDVLGQPLYLFVDEKDQPRVRKLLETAIQTGHSVSYKTEYSGPNGDIIYFESVAAPWIEDGATRGLVVTSRDITDRKQLERSIAESEELFRYFIEDTNNLVTRVNSQGRFTYVNRATQSVFGLKPEESVGKSPFDFIHPEDRDRTQQWFDRVTQEKATKATIENRQVGISGQVHHMSWACSFRYDESSALTDVDSIGRDITQQIQTQKEQQEHGDHLEKVVGVRTQELAKINSQLRDEILEHERTEAALERHESVLESLLALNQMAGASLKEITDFAVEASLKSTESPIGYLGFMNEDESTFTSHSWSREVADECRVADKAAEFSVAKMGLWGKVTLHRKPIIINDYVAPHSKKKGCPQGHVAIKRFLGVPLFDGERIVAVAGVANKQEEYDETDTRQLTLLMHGMWRLLQRQEAEAELHRHRDHLEQSVQERTAELTAANNQLQEEVERRELIQGALAESEQQYRSLVETSQDLIWKCDTQGRFTYLNQAWETTHGYTIGEMLGRPFTEFQDPVAAARDMQVFGRHSAEVPITGHETTYIAKSGKELTLLFNAIPLVDDAGNIVGAQGTASDITDRVRAEKTLHSILKGTAMQTGEDFLRSLTQHLATAMGFRYVLVGELRETDLRQVGTLAFWANGRHEDNFKYDLENTPCKKVVNGSYCCHPRDIQALFPEDQMLVEIDAVSYVGIPLVASSGETIGILAAMHDQPLGDTSNIEPVLTIFAARAAAEIERNRAQLALEKSELRFRAIFEQAPLGIALIDAHTGRFQAVNKRYGDITGYAQEELTSLDFQVATLPDAVREDLQNMAKLRDGAIRFFRMEKHYFPKQKRPIWASLTVAPIWGEGRRPKAHLAMIEDITDRKQMESELEEHRERLEDLVQQRTRLLEQANAELSSEVAERQRIENVLRDQHELIVALSAVHDLKQGLRLCLEAALRASEMDSGGIYLVDEDSGELNLVFQQGLSSEFVQSVSHYDASSKRATLVAKLEPVYTDGRILNVHSNGSLQREGLRTVALLPVVHEGRAIGCLNVASHTREEITDLAKNALETIGGQMGSALARLRAEKALRESEKNRVAAEKLAATGRLAGRVAHEINNPLAGIKNGFRIVRESVSADNRSHKYLVMIEKEIERVAQIVRQMHETYRQEAETPSRCSVNLLLEEVVAMLEPAWSKRDVSVALHCSGEPIIEYLPTNTTRQVLSNLLVNAIDASPTGGEVSLYANRVDHALRLRVVDQGPGIAEELQSQVFEPFYTTKEEGSHSGLGLGLSISQSLAEAAGGSLHLETIPDNGCAFQFNLPITRGKETDPNEDQP